MPTNRTSNQIKKGTKLISTIFVCRIQNQIVMMSSWTAVLRLVGFVATLALALLVVAGNDGAARAMASENNNASAGPFLPDVCAQAQASLLHLQNVNTDASTGEFSQPNQPACVCFFFSSLLRALIIHPIHGTPLLTSPPRFSPLLSCFAGMLAHA